MIRVIQSDKVFCKGATNRRRMSPLQPSVFFSFSVLFDVIVRGSSDYDFVPRRMCMGFIGH